MTIFFCPVPLQNYDTRGFKLKADSEGLNALNRVRLSGISLWEQ